MPDEINPNIQDRTITVPSIVNDFTDAELNSGYHVKSDYENAITKYGIIYKVINFSETDDIDLIKKYAKEWIKENYYDGVHAFTVKAVDLHLLGYQKDKILCGDRVPVEFSIPESNAGIVRRLTCLSAQYDLIKPENSQFTIGVPDTSTNIKYRESVSINQKITKKPTTPQDDGTKIEEITEQVIVDLGLNPEDLTR